MAVIGSVRRVGIPGPQGPPGTPGSPGTAGTSTEELVRLLKSLSLQQRLEILPVLANLPFGGAPEGLPDWKDRVVDGDHWTSQVAPAPAGDENAYWSTPRLVLLRFQRWGDTLPSITTMMPWLTPLDVYAVLSWANDTGAWRQD